MAEQSCEQGPCELTGCVVVYDNCATDAAFVGRHYLSVRSACVTRLRVSPISSVCHQIRVTARLGGLRCVVSLRLRSDTWLRPAALIHSRAHAEPEPTVRDGP